MKKKIQAGNFSDKANIVGVHYCEIKTSDQLPLPKDFESFNFILKDGSIGRIASIFKEDKNSMIQISFIFNKPNHRDAELQTWSDSKLLSEIQEFL